MHTFHKIPVDLLHVGERINFPVYYEHDEKLTLFLRKKSVVSARQRDRCGPACLPFLQTPTRQCARPPLAR